MTEYESEGARLVLSGHVGVAEAAALHAALAELLARPGGIVVDQARLTGCDASLVQLLVAFARARRAAGRAVAVGPGPATERLLQLDLDRELGAPDATPR